MKVYSLSTLVKEVSANFKISKKQSRKLVDFFVERIVDNSINNKVFIKKFGTFSSKIVTKRSFNGLNIKNTSSNKDVISVEGDSSHFITQKPKVVFLPSLEYRNKIMNNKNPDSESESDQE